MVQGRPGCGCRGSPSLHVAGLGLLVALAIGGTAPAQSEPLTLTSVNEAQYSGPIEAGEPSAVMLKAQILLGRLDISPGQINGRPGENARRAVAAFQRARGLEDTGYLDLTTWSELIGASPGPALVEYTVARDDVKGPFAGPLSDDMTELARLRWLGYRSPTELLAAKFHVAESLLRLINDDMPLDRAGDVIVVPNVTTPGQPGQVVRIEVDKQNREVRALGPAGEVVAFYPASLGPDQKPSPSGSYRVRRVVRYPIYRYNPRYELTPVDIKRTLKIAPGPNSPIGLVWIDFAKPTYGIHGTSDPAGIGRAASHGCVRLTNWDVLDLASRVRRGTEVVFVD